MPSSKQSHPHGQARQRANIPAGAAFHDGLAKVWSRGYAAGSFRRRLKFVSDRLDQRLRPGQTWIDAGCGSGVLSRELAKRGANVVAMDGSPAMLSHARAESGATNLTVRYELIDSIERLPVSNAGVDGVLCSSVLEYVDDPQQTLFEFHRVLRPAGVLVLSVPNQWSVIRMAQQTLRSIARLVGLALFDYLSVSRHAYSRHNLRAAMEQSGFEIEEIALFSPYMPHLLCPLGLGAIWLVVGRRSYVSQMP